MTRWQLMKQVTIRNQRCARTCSIVLRQAIKVVAQANGRLVKLRCLLNNIKQKAEAIETNGKEAYAKEPKQMDFGKMADPKW